MKNDQLPMAIVKKFAARNVQRSLCDQVYKDVKRERFMPLTWTINDWVKILREQAEYFKAYRHALYKKVNIKSAKEILDIGCGTGVITKDIASRADGCVTGVDVDGEKLVHARQLVRNIPCIRFLKADCQKLPFKNETFDLVVFCLVLMYIGNKQKAVKEMARVTKKDGIILATMEPDYASTIHYPENLMLPLFFKNMEEFGADLCMGRKLRYIFGKAGLKTEIGIHMWNFDFMNNGEDLALFLKQFWLTERTLSRNGWTEQQISTYKREQIQLIEKGLSFSFMPVYYAIGTKERL